MEATRQEDKHCQSHNFEDRRTPIDRSIAESYSRDVAVAHNFMNCVSMARGNLMKHDIGMPETSCLYDISTHK